MTFLSTTAFGTRKPQAALLGLALDGSRLQGVVVRRQNGSLRAGPSFTAALALDPLTNDPELVGREVRNHLEAAGIRERRCAVAVPLAWALTVHTEIPAMPEADVAAFLQVEAERGFPCDAATLQRATSVYTTPSGARHATVVGIPSSHVERLRHVLCAARLKPVSFSLGIAALQTPSTAAGDGVLALALGESQIALQVTCGHGVAALRTLDGAIETIGGRRMANADLAARDARITLGQLAPTCRAAVTRIRLFGLPAQTRALAEALGPLVHPLGMTVDVVARYAPDELGATLPPETDVSAAFSLAARRLTGSGAPLEFLPPRIPPWKQLATRYASAKLRAAGAVAAALAVLLAGAFGVQQAQWARANAQWAKMAGTVGELEAVQQQIRQYRPWFDPSFRSLTLLRALSLAFPEDGAVTAKTLEIRDATTARCSGMARDPAALLRMLSQLRAVDGVHDVQVDQIRGQTPVQFTFGFQYGDEVPHEP